MYGLWAGFQYKNNIWTSILRWRFHIYAVTVEKGSAIDRVLLDTWLMFISNYWRETGIEHNFMFYIKWLLIKMKLIKLDASIINFVLFGHHAFLFPDLFILEGCTRGPVKINYGMKNLWPSHLVSGVLSLFKPCDWSTQRMLSCDWLQCF